ncbi:protein phosphatase [Kutzneria viridogrisea]|uniref:Protein phosphatase n=1 Tax=Kutzneria viridogrisea TaxID=47990 RepID=A0ABR6BMQ5_9PSEU|nr:serine/threonine protein phosphatase [Kutzneria albida]MBA8928178.1 protein phosphatase [Kutzneria viridogrisea]
MNDLVQGTTAWDAASGQGQRRTNADAVACRRDPDSGQFVFAVADGIGDTAGSAEAARKAVKAAVATPSGHGAIQAVLAAQQVLRNSRDDCVIVVAVPFTDRVSTGYRIAWVGDCRAYLWDDNSVTQLTVDQTVAAYLRSQLRPTTPHMEHIVTNTVRTTTTDQIGWTQVRTAGSGLLLSTDGVHKIVPAATMHRELAHADQPARALTAAAETLGGRDNASAIVIDWTGRRPSGQGTMTDLISTLPRVGSSSVA